MTLTQVAIFTRRAIIALAVLIIVGLFSFIGYKIWYANYLASIPPVEEKPDLKFGSLPEINFPPSKVSSANFSYSLDTTTGNLPTFGKIIKVYFQPKPISTFLAPERSKDIARLFDVDTEPQILSETKYQFALDKKNLIIDLDSGNFLFSQSEASNSASGAEGIKNRPVDFKQFLSQKDLLKENLKNGPVKELANIISVWPQDIDKIPIKTDNLDISLIYAEVIGSPLELKNYSLLQYIYWPIDTTTFATYYLKTGNAAFEDLKQGKGIIMMEPEKPQVSVTLVYLAYFQNKEYSPYLQPIFVFEGPHFAAFVDAIAR